MSKNIFHKINCQLAACACVLKECIWRAGLHVNLKNKKEIPISSQHTMHASIFHPAVDFMA